MRKFIILALSVLAFCTSGIAFASLNDTKASIENQYGDYRMVIDTDNQIWAKTEWEQKGHIRAKAASYTYSFDRQGLGVQMEVAYTSDTPQAQVRAQRFTPNMAIKVKEFKKYFPEVYSLIASSKAQAFASYDPVTRQFQELQSPVTMGVVVQTAPTMQKSNYTLLVFNIQDEGRLIRDAKYIDDNTYIREFTIERILAITASDNLQSNQWQPIKNYFN